MSCTCQQPCTCNCAQSPAALSSPINRAGLPALETRIGDYWRFLDAAVQQLSSPDHRALAALGTRDTNDPALALLDAWAVAGDVLTFYRQVLTNEGYLRTATQERSLREIVRLIGYKPRPGVSATTCLAYEIDPTAGPVTIDRGAKVQSVPGPDEAMQTFETDEALMARPAWSRLRPVAWKPKKIDRLDALLRRTLWVRNVTPGPRPGQLLFFNFGPDAGQQIVREIASVESDLLGGRTALRLKPRVGFDKRVGVEVVARQILKLADKAFQLANVDAIARDRQGGRLATQAITSLLLGGSVADAVRRLTQIIRPHGPELPDGLRGVLEELIKVLDRTRIVAKHPPVQRAPFGIENLYSTLGARAVKASSGTASRDRSVLQQLASGGDLRVNLVVAKNPGFEAATLFEAWKNFRTPADDTDVTVHLMGSTFSPFGASAPRRPVAVTARKIELREWPIERNDREALHLETIDDSVQPGTFALVSSPVDYLTEAVVELPGGGHDENAEMGDARIEALWLRSAQTVGRGSYGMSGKALRLDLAVLSDQSEYKLPLTERTDLGFLRRTTITPESTRLQIAPDTVDEDVGGDSIELDGVYDGLATGRKIIVEGERTDVRGPDGPIPGLRAAELAVIVSANHVVDAQVPADSPRTLITLESELAHRYLRSSVVIFGNVATASHGETVSEVLGSASASAQFAKFGLRRAPLTFVPAPTPSGVEGSDVVRVNDMRYQSVDSLLDAGPTERVHETQTDERGAATEVFGNGQYGARLPTGTENVRARYRVGIGMPGNLQANQLTLLATKPLGVSSVTNPLRATGGADRDTAEHIRRNAPVAIGALSRLVSLSDYASFARAFAGIGAADAVRIAGGGRDLVHVTVQGVADAPLDEDGALIQNLLLAFQRYGDPALPVVIAIREMAVLVLQANLGITDDAEWEVVEAAARKAVLARFGPDQRGLGRSAYLSEVIAMLQALPGVDWVDVDVFGSIPEDALSGKEAFDSAVAALNAANPFVRCQRAKLVDEITGRISPAQTAAFFASAPGTLIFNQARETR